ncbi:hypothetical protein [Streptomyces sp. NPDC058678]|uniref:hypothetical protein n=1 Tax=Streptomyces sp. NPDC058678 TaxID=3346595 RepID=UPI00365D2AAD
MSNTSIPQQGIRSLVGRDLGALAAADFLQTSDAVAAQTQAAAPARRRQVSPGLVDGWLAALA